MKVGRNDPCPCGSGKKYKKCCLAKDQLVPPPEPEDPEAPEPEEMTAEESWQEPEPAEKMLSEAPVSALDGPQQPPAREYPRPNQELPNLTPEQDKIIRDWWKIAGPLYKKRDSDRLIQRVEMALTEFPDLFPQLRLHEELLFELGADLARHGKMPQYIALLKRLRREQRQMYSFCYGAYDSDVIAELIITGQAQEIPAYLDLFKEYPDAQPDHCHETCDLLAWSGLAEPLYLLCEAVATPMVTSSQVINGCFALDWLIRREEILFYERGDTSHEALKGTVAAIKALGERIDHPLDPNPNWLRTGLKGCLELPKIQARGILGDNAQHQLQMSFVSHLVRSRKIPWVSAFLLGDRLLDYFWWCRREEVPWTRLKDKEIDSFAASHARQFFSLNGVRVLTCLQMAVWFAEYLGAADVMPPGEPERVKRDCRRFFESARKSVESTDPAYRLCPTFERLIGG
jgi:hypothetical protein